MNDAVKFTLGRRIRIAREYRKLSQDDLAGRLNVTRVAVSQWENSDTTPKRGRIVVIADTLGVSVAWLYGEGPDDLDVADAYTRPTAPMADLDRALLSDVMLQVEEEIARLGPVVIPPEQRVQLMMAAYDAAAEQRAMGMNINLGVVMAVIRTLASRHGSVRSKGK